MDAMAKTRMQWILDRTSIKGKDRLEERINYQCTYAENIRRRDWNRLDMERRNNE